MPSLHVQKLRGSRRQHSYIIILPSFSALPRDTALRTWHRDGNQNVEQLPFLLLLQKPPIEDKEIEMDSGNKSDYRRVQIDRKPSCQPPPTLGKARNNSACNEVVLKRFPAALLQLADRLYSARLCGWWWITICSQWHQSWVNRPKIQIWSRNNCEVSYWGKKHYYRCFLIKRFMRMC